MKKLLLTLTSMCFVAGALAQFNDCVESGPRIKDWVCVTGSVDNPGTLDETEKIICVGDSAGTGVSGTTFNNGKKTRKIEYDCQEDEEESGEITYSPSVFWEPPIPESFPDCGIFTFTAKVKGVTGDTDCPAETEAVEVGTFTVKVVAVEDLTPSDGALIPDSSPPKYVVCVGPGDVTVTASPCPGLPEEELPGCWTLVGGEPIEQGKLRRKVSKETPSDTTFTCTAGTTQKKVRILVVKIEVLEIHFNHDPNSANSDGVTIKKDKNTDIVAPEWVKASSKNDSICYIKNKQPDVKVKLKAQPASVTSAKIKASSVNELLPGLNEQTVSFSDGVSSLITFTMSSQLLEPV